MKLTINTKVLAGALGKLKTLAGHKTTLPILSNVLLETGTLGGLQLTATDLDQRLCILIDAEVSDAGSITVPCGMLHALVTRMDCAEVAIETNEKHVLTVSGGSRKSKLAGLASQEFPVSPDVNVSHEIRLDGETFGKWLEKLAPCMSTDDARPVICGVHFESAKGKLRLIATDGRLMLRILSELSVDIPSLILPAAAVKTFSCLISDGEVTMAISENCVVLRGGSWTLLSRLIEGNFPSTDQLIPARSERKYRINVDRKAIIAAVNYASTFCAQNSISVQFVCSPDQVLVKSPATEVGESEAVVTGDKETPNLVFNLNPEYFLTILKAYAGERVTVEARDAMSPFTIDQENIESILMPMRVS